MNKPRLLKLAALLEADARRKRGIRFDMDRWGTIEDPEKPLSCGTTACAMGLAALSGKFKRAGLGYVIEHGAGLLITMRGSRDGGGVEAAMELFDLTNEEALDLFIMPGGKGARGERRLAKIIRRFVKTGVVYWRY
jgi:hypothetical protein